MAKRSPAEQLDRAVEAILAARDAALPGVPPALEPLARIARGLCALPRPEFRTRLKAELERRASMSATPKAVPEARRAATPYLCVRGAAAAIEFYKEVFGATEVMRLTEPAGRIGHAEIAIGESRLCLSDEYPEFGVLSPHALGGTPVRISLEVADSDEVVARALAAGAQLLRPVQDQFYGSRSGQVVDPFGHRWNISTLKQEMGVEEMQRRYDELLRQASAAAAPLKQPPARGFFIREGFHTLTPYILASNAPAFIEFMKQAFGAVEKLRVPVPTGKIMHAEVQVGNSMIELADGNEQYPPLPVAIHLSVNDADTVYARALEAGATSLYEPADQHWGDREGGVKDAFGNHWYISSAQPGTAGAGQFHALQPYLHLRQAGKMIDFAQSAFGAEAVGVVKEPGGGVLHATLRIGDSTFEIAEAYRVFQPMPCHLHLYVPDTDALYERALRAGATSIEPPTDKPYGDRAAGVKDPFGNSWFLATHIKDVAF